MNNGIGLRLAYTYYRFLFFSNRKLLFMSLNKSINATDRYAHNLFNTNFYFEVEIQKFFFLHGTEMVFILLI